MRISGIFEYLDPLQRLDPLTKVGPVNCIIEEVATVFGHAKTFRWVVGTQQVLISNIQRIKYLIVS